MNFLRTTYPGKPIVFMTPARCLYENIDDLYPSCDQRKIADAKPLIEYVKIIEETAVQFSIPTLNLYENLGLDPHDPDIHKKYTVDGLHFNDAGHEIIAEKLKDFIDSL